MLIPPPPNVVRIGSVMAHAKFAATAASNAFPPCSNIFPAALALRGCPHAIIPFIENQRELEKEEIKKKCSQWLFSCSEAMTIL
jgi:hypothetical protein